jgi:acyl-coenzyme A synthetase/AMP-(fatty) acid ligase/pimeloyl-ACP methyl ester carboxylesterase
VNREVAPPAAASLPPSGLFGLRPQWSRLVQIVDADGVRRTFHLLDNGVEPNVGTLLCVHGNPTWSYLWRRLVADAPAGWRVIAIDHLDMGFSDRTGTRRDLARRIDDLGRLTSALDLTGPVVTVAHDWGGPISLGWALAHRSLVAGVVLTNTAVHQPAHSAAPSVIRLARTPALRQLTCLQTPTFIEGTLRLNGRPDPQARQDFLAPYRTAARRAAISAFVADIPLEPAHPSARTLDGIAASIGAELADIPTLLLWGPRDPVFGDRYLADLLTRLPQSDVHRFEGASHLVIEDAPELVPALGGWLEDRFGAGVNSKVAVEVATAATELPRIWTAIDAYRDSDATAIVSWLDGAQQSLSWRDLATRIERTAAGLVAAGWQPGERVGLLIPPGPDLTVVLYAAWRIGVVVVIADAGLGLRGLRRAFRGATPNHLVGIAKGLTALRDLGVPGSRILVDKPLPVTALTGHTTTLAAVERCGATTLLGNPHASGTPRADPTREDFAAVVFTSGATGPAKGVAYRHRQLEAQTEALRTTYGITAEDRLVAAFAPFALYGPALGIPSAVPDMDVTAPGTLTATALATAVDAIDATLVFASPAALRNVVATAGRPLHGVRLLLSAGAPVPADLLRRLSKVLPDASAHTPYGMTECLPVTDIDLPGIDAAGVGNGVCVGRAVPGVSVSISPLDVAGNPTEARTIEPDVTGEILVDAAHRKDHYDRLWWTERKSSTSDGWHRTGDVGHFDAEGRLWVEGRLVHLISTATGVLTPVGIEQAVESAAGVELAAVVGVGPVGTQQLVIVVQQAGAKAGPAPLAFVDAVRALVPHPLAAVLITPKLPVDIRHNSKIDRAAVAKWATRVLSGGR